MAVSAEIELGNLRIDLGEEAVYLGERRVDLTAREFRLLHEFVRHAGRVLTRQRLREVISDDNGMVEPDRLNVHVHRLRRKLYGGHPWTIDTVTKRGYVLRLHSGPS